MDAFNAYKEMLDGAHEPEAINGRIEAAAKAVAAKTIRIRADETRLMGLPFGVIRRMQEQDFNVMARFLSQFVADEDGQWIEPAAAAVILDELPFSRVVELAGEVYENLKDAAAPKV